MPDQHPADRVAEQVIEWRRHLHRHPEPSFEESGTADWIANALAEHAPGVEVRRPSDNAVVGTLKGAEPGPTILLRADIDALRIHEESGVEFASTRPGLMHACGHDGHSAMLLGAAAVLSAEPPAKGEIRFVFQPAEELAPGGAVELVKAGVMDGVDLVYGCHLWTGLDLGGVAAHPGVRMAAADFFELTVTGQGGHAGLPHTTVDAVAIAAQVVTNLQHIVARTTDPLAPAVVTIGSIHAGELPNVIAETAVLRGTARSFDPDLRTRIPDLIERIAGGVAAAHDATAELDYTFGYAPVDNDPEVTQLVNDVVPEAERVDLPPIMGGDDFSAYLAGTPGCYAFIGTRSEQAGSAYPHHHPRFRIDERSLQTGTRLHVDVARRACSVAEARSLRRASGEGTVAEARSSRRASGETGSPA